MQALLVFGVGTLLALVVQSRYWSAGRFFDDFEHQRHLRDVVAGRSTLTSFLFQTHNEHFLPAWKLWYYMHWRWFADTWWVWHVSMTLAHLGTGACVLLLLRRYLNDARMAALGTLLWLACAIGGLDNPLLWISASHLSFAVFWVAAAMVCVTRIDARLYPVWIAAMVACLVLAVATMAASWLMLLALPAQLLMLERPRLRSDRRVLAFGAAWFVVFVALGLWTIPIVAATSAGVVVPKDANSWAQALARSGGSLTLAGSRLVLDVRDLPTAGRLAAEGVVMLVALTVSIFALRVDLRLLAVIACLCGPYIVVCHLARLSFDWRSVLDWGRYGYLPTLAWCLLLAAIADAAWARLRGWGRHVFVFAATVAVVLVTIAQLGLADDAAQRFARSERQTRDLIDECRAPLSEMAAYARQTGRPVRLLEFPLAPPQLPYMSDLVVALRDDLAGQIEVVDAAGFSAADLDHAQAAMGVPRHRDLPAQWRARLTTVYEYHTLLRRLSDEGLRQRRLLPVPNLRIQLAPRVSMTFEDIALLTCPGGLPGIRFLKDRTATPAEADALRATLNNLSTPAARDFRNYLETNVNRPN